MLGFGFIYILYYIFLLASKYVFFYSAIQCVTLFNFIKVTLKPRLFTLVFLILLHSFPHILHTTFQLC